MPYCICARDSSSNPLPLTNYEISQLCKEENGRYLENSSTVLYQFSTILVLPQPSYHQIFVFWPHYCVVHPLKLGRSLIVNCRTGCPNQAKWSCYLGPGGWKTRYISHSTYYFYYSILPYRQGHSLYLFYLMVNYHRTGCLNQAKCSCYLGPSG